MLDPNVIAQMVEQEIRTAVNQQVQQLLLFQRQLFQQDFEFWISRLATDEEERGNEVGSLLLRQLLIGWGADAFLQIALRFQEDN